MLGKSYPQALNSIKFRSVNEHHKPRSGKKVDSSYFAVMAYDPLGRRPQQPRSGMSTIAGMEIHRKSVLLPLPWVDRSFVGHFTCLG